MRNGQQFPKNRTVRNYLYPVVIAVAALAPDSLAWAKSELKCSPLLNQAFYQVAGSPQAFEAWVREKTSGMAQILREHLESLRVRDKDASTALRRAVGNDEQYPAANFHFAVVLDNIGWPKLASNLSTISNFARGHLSYHKITPQTFHSALKFFDDGSGVLNPVYFENIVQETFRSTTKRLQYAQKALSTLKQAQKFKPREFKLSDVDEAAHLLAAWTLQLRETLPPMGALSFQLHRLLKYNETTQKLPPADLVTRETFENYLTRDSTLRCIWHDYLQLEQQLTELESEVTVAAVAAKLRQDPMLLESLWQRLR